MYILFTEGKTHYHDDVNLINLQIQINRKPHIEYGKLILKVTCKTKESRWKEEYGG